MGLDVSTFAFPPETIFALSGQSLRYESAVNEKGLRMAQPF
jgi:hypothetical protein